MDDVFAELDTAEALCADLLHERPTARPGAAPDVVALLARLDDRLEAAGLPVEVVGLSPRTVELRHRHGPATGVALPAWWLAAESPVVEPLTHLAA